MTPAPADEAAAYRLLEELRWGGPPTSCPHCGATGRCYFLRPAGGDSRRTRTGAASPRRVWRCAACRRQFSVLVGTVLAGTRISVRTWVAAIADIAERERGGSPLGVSEIAERYGLSGEAARRMVRRVRMALDAAGEYSIGHPAAALLALSPGHAARIRELTPARIRPRRQVGPGADYGTGGS